MEHYTLLGKHNSNTHNICTDFIPKKVWGKNWPTNPISLYYTKFWYMTSPVNIPKFKYVRP